MKILAVSGSLREASSNTLILRAAVELAPLGVDIVLYEGLSTLPFFNPDLDGDEPPLAVKALRREVGLADGLLICSPEYARGVAGVLKNGLDWLVASHEFPDKPVAVINASQRATAADAALRLTLETMSARLIETACVSIPMLGRTLTVGSFVQDPLLAGRLQEALASFVDAIRGTRT